MACCICVFFGFLTIIATFLYIYSKKKEPNKIFGIYSQRGKWFYLKYLLFLCLLSIRKLRTKMGKSGTGLGMSIKEEDLEKAQTLSEHPKALDSVFVIAANKEGFYICGGLERRHKGIACGHFHIIVPGIGLLLSEKLPKTDLKSDSTNGYSAEGISFTLVEPMRRWRINFEGKMRLHDKPSKLFNVKFEGDWYSDLPHFMFDSQMSSRAVARAVAKEEWNRDYFQGLQNVHQSHYEQMGYIKTKLKVDGKEYDFEMDSFRDHSFAHKRDWTQMFRYASHIIFLENGLKITIIIVSQPYLSQIEMGFVSYPNKVNHAIESCDFLLYQHGENGIPGNDYAFSFVANGERFVGKFMTISECEHFKGNNVESRLVERFMTCEINGIPGRALCEWQYKNTHTN